MFNLKPLHHFVLVAEERNFGAAAERAHLSQPALSNSIKTLETQLGFKLFQRQERPIKLTAEGRELYQRARDLLFEARNLDRRILSLKRGEAGHIRFGLVPTFAASLGGRIISACHRANPGLSFDVEVLQTSGLVQGLMAETLELIVCDLRELADPSALEVTPLPPHPGGCFCRPGHPLLAQDRPPTLHEIFDHGLASVHMPGALRRALAARFIPPGDDRPLLQLECDNVTLLSDAVLASDLVLVTTRSSLADALAEGRLRQVGPALDSSAVWGIATLRGRTLHPGAPRMIDWIRSCAAPEEDTAAG
ncbi:LysR family transcriptional regulator [Pseudodonghicola flavimaris]|uniref:LysR family transcriptional regulator n=1 Tax=Pseudodonghicola flavimaris TaxID=3050036 RepID=A0ABT7EYZ9_9RHOB|nr:LysR family transcriptional regulator [Pseudodonghicola flavimaris]MDK3017589.1 LysR family transcriptional regulator [Pseudodonghicola flavimaris]